MTVQRPTVIPSLLLSLLRLSQQNQAAAVVYLLNAPKQ
jgi:hypothetical protein